MTTNIIDSIYEWEGSGSFWVSGTTTKTPPGALTHSPWMSYCRGPKELNSGSILYATSSFDYVWRARYDTIDPNFPEDVGGYQIYIERQLSGSVGWETYNSVTDVLGAEINIGDFLANNDFNNIDSLDFSIDVMGRYYIVFSAYSNQRQKYEVWMYSTQGINLSGSNFFITEEFVKVDDGRFPVISYKEV